jgi:hypothetical protein
MQRIRHVALVVDPAQLRGFHAELALRLSSEIADRVTVTWGRSRYPIPAAVDLLFELERLTQRTGANRLSRCVDARSVPLAETSPQERPDLLIDFCGQEAPAADRVVRVLYDGLQSETAAIGAIVHGRMPTIAIEEAGTGAQVTSGAPCADNAGSVSEAFECVLARAVTLLLAGVRNGSPTAGRVAPSPAGEFRLRSLAAFEVKAMAHAVVRHLYRLCFYTPHWRCCWRFVDGPDVWTTRTLSGAPWNIVPDPGYRFYADPFPFELRGRSYLFVEDLDHRRGKAIISVLPFGETGPIGPAQRVLEEPWHLSYPHLIEHAGQVWMIPESSENKSIALYRAVQFPNEWVREAVLVSDIEASDATVIRHDGRFWLFAATRDGAGSWSDTLSIFFANDLLGPWVPHPRNPILVDQATARPAGAMVVRDGKLWRPVQDCTGGYGTGIGLAEVTRLDPDGFEQTVHAVLRPDPAWPGRRLHTLNRSARLECIDGAAYSPRSRLLARRLQSWSGRRDFSGAGLGVGRLLPT